MPGDLATAGTDGVVSSTDVARLEATEGGLHRLMTLLLPAAAVYARPPISRYRVGSVVRGLTHGNLYFGANLEFTSQALSFTVHAEQSAVANAWAHGEREIDLVATSAPPCGFCRQFLNELSNASQLEIVTTDGTTPLRALLPASFGPHDLGIDGGLLAAADHGLEIDAQDDLAQAALLAANRSYAPYSHAYAGVAVRTREGKTASGSYGENAAFNPSLSPLQAALSNLNLAGGSFDSIEEAVLVQSSELHSAASLAVLSAVCPAPLRVIAARNSTRPPSS